MRNSISWDDLAVVLAIGRTGTLAGAARDLKVNHSTVFRRIGQIEEQLGTRLFDRKREGYHPTAAGEAAINLASRMQDDVLSFERQLAGADLRPSGLLRFTTSETFLPILSPILARFLAEYPEICVEVVTGSQALDLSRRDADVALRVARVPPETLHGRRIATIAFAVYGTDEFQRYDGDVLDAPRWLGLDDSLSHLRGYAWLKANVPPSRVAMRASGFVPLLHAAAEGIGVALLPCYAADMTPGLRRLSPIISEVSSDIWLLVHADIRKTTRVKAFTDFLFAELVRLRGLFEGDAP